MPPEPRASVNVHLESSVEKDLTVTSSLGSKTTEDQSTQSEVRSAAERESEKKEKNQPFSPPSYLPIHAYASSNPSPVLPDALEPFSSIPQRRLLGFLNTSIRIYRYLNQRQLADEICQQVAALALGESRSYYTTRDNGSIGGLNSSLQDPPADGQLALEQQQLLYDEEKDWHKSVRKPRDDRLERIWLNVIVIDPQIGERMQKFILDSNTSQAGLTVK